jgi:hypothetical protein
MSIDWKKLLGKAAPAIASVVGTANPVAGMALRVLGATLLKNPEAKEDEVAAALATSDPATLLKLKEAEMAFTEQMAQYGLRLEEIDAGDRASARAREIALHDRTPSIIAAVVLLAFVMALVLVLNHQIPPGMHDVAITMLGTLGAMVMTVVTYYFGSSRGSRQKDELLGQAAGK